MRLAAPFALALAVALATSPAASAADDDKGDASVAAFTSLKAEVEALRRDEKRRLFRHHYDALVGKLKKLHDARPSAQRADDALFVSAQLAEELYYVSRIDADRDAAVAAFRQLAELHPTSNLADDALLAAARLTADGALATNLLERVVAMGAKADMAGEARALLKTRAASSSTAAATGRDDRMAAALAKVAAPAVAAPPAQPPIVEVLPERPPAGAPSRKVVVIRHEKTATESLVRVRLSGDVGITRGEVPPQNGQPRRIFFDLVPAKLGQRNIQPIDIGDGVVARLRAGQYDTDVVRIVIELLGNDEPSLRVQKRPFELQLSVPVPRSADAPAVAAAETAAPPPVAEAPRDAKPRVQAVAKKLTAAAVDGGVSISQQLGLKVHRIVIDAGHGGNDTGAIGPTGVKEKEVTLSLAKRVRDRLLKELPDVEVILTREDDATLALQDRTNVANAAGADLFISIHCNASPLRRVRGVETYTLNITSDRYAMKLAARENAEAGEGSISDLEYILADLAMKSNVDDSVRLGESVQKSMVRRLRKSYDGVKDLGLKHALFYVLMGNHMPSILVETSFLSHREEEKRLASDAYQDALAEGIVHGVRAFVEDRQAFYAP